jgi:hypothetical protein
VSAPMRLEGREELLYQAREILLASITDDQRQNDTCGTSPVHRSSRISRENTARAVDCDEHHLSDQAVSITLHGATTCRYVRPTSCAADAYGGPRTADAEVMTPEIDSLIAVQMDVVHGRQSHSSCENTRLAIFRRAAVADCPVDKPHWRSLSRGRSLRPPQGVAVPAYS